MFKKKTAQNSKFKKSSLAPLFQRRGWGDLLQLSALSFQLSSLFLGLSLFLASSFVCLSPTRAAIIDRIAAVVDSDIITDSDVDDVLAERQKEFSTDRKLTKESKREEVLNKMIDDLILKHSIDKAKVTVDDDDLARAIANVLRQNHMTIEQLRSDLSSKGIGFEVYKRRLTEQIRLIKFTNQVIGQQVKLTDRDLRDYYDRNKSLFGGDGSSFEAMRDKIYDVLYEERLEEALNNYLTEQRKKAYIDIR